jgi:hypothetical protein
MPDSEPLLDSFERQTREHAAWLDVVIELRERGAGEIEPEQKDYPLWAAITKWGEELAQLRLRDPDPDHAENAVAMARERYPGQYEADNYPSAERRS